MLLPRLETFALKLPETDVGITARRDFPSLHVVIIND